MSDQGNAACWVRLVSTSVWNQGPIVTGVGPLAAYTIDVGFTLDQLNGPRGDSHVKLIDFSSLVSDAGDYSHHARLDAFPPSDSDPVFSAGTPVRLTLSRDNAGLITAYIDGTQIYAQADTGNASATLIDGLNPLTFFTDDLATGQGEASSGFVDHIRLYDTAIAGVGMVGAGLRQRRRRSVLRHLAA